MKKGFTLVEILVVMSIFSLVSMVALNAFFSTYKVQIQSSSTNALISESRVLMDKVVRIVEKNKLDYEEYFYQCNVAQKCPLINYENKVEAGSEFGREDGLYTWQFYDPGFRNAELSIRDSYGLVCQNAGGIILDYPNDACASGPLRFSEDIHIGSFYQDNGINNAFSIQSNYNQNNVNGLASPAAGKLYVLPDTDSVIVSELYLKSMDENKKTIIGRELNGDNNMLSVLELISGDNESDGANKKNSKKFTCAPNYDCGVGNVGLRYDFYDNENLFEQAKPISPFRLNVESLWFQLSPLNDREQNFAANINTPQSVTISMVLTASNQNNLNLFNNSPFRYVLTKTVVLSD